MKRLLAFFNARRLFTGAIALALAAIIAGCETADTPATAARKARVAARFKKPTVERVRWLTDLEQAKQVAAADGKDLFLLFTGSSWCGRCKELERDVLTTAEFAAAAEQFVLVKFDYPPGATRLPQEPPEPNVSWGEMYSGGRPSIVLADSAGRPYGVIVPNGLKVAPFMEHIWALHTGRVRRDAAFAKAKISEGNEKAANLAEALLALAKSLRDESGGSNVDMFFRFYRDEMDTVERLDADAVAVVSEYFDGFRRAEQELQAFYAALNETQVDDGLEAALRFVDAQVAATKSVKNRFRFREVKRGMLEQANQNEEALSLARELAADESAWAEERLRNRQRIVYNLGRLGRVDEAIDLWGEMLVEAADKPWRQFWLLADIAEVFWHQQRYAEALATWEQAIGLAEPKSDNWLHAQTFRVRTLARMGRESEAWKGYETIVANGTVTPLERAGMMASIAQMLNENGMREAALNAASRTEKALAEAKVESQQDKIVADSIRRMLDQLKSPAADQAGTTASAATPGKDE